MRTIGEPPYLSTVPLYHALKATGISEDFEVSRARLSHLSERLVNGTIDAGPISVLTYLQHRDSLDLIPNMALSSMGAGGSGVLVSTKPIGTSAEFEVAVPSLRDGTVYLLRWLFAEMFGYEPMLVERVGNPEHLLEEHGAALLFEDQALSARYRTPGLHVWDLGDAWWQCTHTPLLYMLWVARKEVPEAEREALAARFGEAKRSLPGLKTEILKDAQEQSGYPAEYLENFWSRFNYDFSPAHQTSLRLFEQYVYSLDPAR
ncbi:Chorismate dehydratase [compost metagenome]